MDSIRGTLVHGGLLAALAIGWLAATGTPVTAMPDQEAV
jgi:hypothetical protein